MPALLEVRFGSTVVGRIRVDDNDRFTFVYDTSWQTNGARFPISLTLPIAADEYAGGPAHSFFANLLPEGAVRQGVCARLGISEDNDFALLQAIGGECAGALSLVDPTLPPADPQQFAYEELDDKRLQELVSDDAIPLLVGGSTTRLSLAGAQDKIPIALFDGKIHLPLNAAPSTHILKLPNRRYAHLPANEAFALGLARRLELDVVNAELSNRTDPASLLVTRYDRVQSNDPSAVQRLHQEDLCQATGLPSTKKYEMEGGPNFVRVANVIRDNVYQPLVDVPRLIKWQAFNLVIGNSDGHAKNLSIAYLTGGEKRLAPFYDLVSTREYKRLDRKLAMGIGGRQNPDEVTRTEWAKLSQELKIGERVVFDLVKEVAERSLDTLAVWTREFRDAFGNQPILQTLPGATGKRARRVLRSLET